MEGQELYNHYYRYYDEFETGEDRILEKLAKFAWSYRE